MLAMFDDMNVTETSKLVSQYKGKYSRCLYQFNGYKKIIIAKNEMLEEC
jgi:hypothetical protein